MDCTRYAIWWVPRTGTALARFGAEWTGWDADRGTASARRALAALSKPRAGVPGEARLRGLHATLRAPFRLGQGRSRWALEGALAEFAAHTVPLRLPRLRIEVDDGRVVLAPMRPDEGVTQLLTGLNEALRPIEVPPDWASVSCTGVIAAGGLVLPDRQDEPTGLAQQLARFRITLTDRLPAGQAEQVAAELAPVLAPVLLRPQVIGDLGLVGDPGRGRPWRLLERYALEGDGAGAGGRLPAGMNASGPSLISPIGGPGREAA